MKGTVKSFNSRRGFGFITGEDGNDIFVHYSEIRKDGFKTLKAGEHVSYDVDTDDQGRTVARNVVNE